MSREMDIIQFIQTTAENNPNNWQAELQRYNEETGSNVTPNEFQNAAYSMAEDSLRLGDERKYTIVTSKISHPIYAAFNLPQSTK